jgi:hypothetical protein
MESQKPEPAWRRWTPAEEKQLQDMLDAGKTAVEISRKLRRTFQAYLCPFAARLQTASRGPRRSTEGEGEMTMRVLLILAAMSFSAAAFAQSAPPKIGDKPLVHTKPGEPTGCKLVGTVKGTKLWAGDCVGSELRGAISATETQSLSDRATAVIPPGQKQ